MPDKPVTTIGKLQFLQLDQKSIGLHLDGLSQQAPRSRSKDIRQRIIDLARPAQPVNVRSLGHGVSLSFGGSGGLDTRLDTSPFQTVITQIPP